MFYGFHTGTVKKRINKEEEERKGSSVARQDTGCGRLSNKGSLRGDSLFPPNYFPLPFILRSMLCELRILIFKICPPVEGEGRGGCM